MNAEQIAAEFNRYCLQDMVPPTKVMFIKWAKDNATPLEVATIDKEGVRQFYATHVKDYRDRQREALEVAQRTVAQLRAENQRLEIENVLLRGVAEFYAAARNWSSPDGQRFNRLIQGDGFDRALGVLVMLDKARSDETHALLCDGSTTQANPSHDSEDAPTA